MMRYEMVSVFVFPWRNFLMLNIMGKTGAALKTVETLHQIVNLELAFTKKKTDSIIGIWEKKNVLSDAINNTHWDFLFIFFYTGLFFLMCKGMALQFYEKRYWFRTGWFFAKFSLVAGIFDVAENLLMLQSFNGNRSELISFCTGLFASIKFTILILAAIFIVTAGIFWILKN
ncbi:MAG: hypothetical protein IPH58_13740 [Sphingobacteriales bacterium]|nr:hypothetical protein [Sphingobacteriales bacterium]